MDSSLKVYSTPALSHSSVIALSKNGSFNLKWVILSSVKPEEDWIDLGCLNSP